MMFNRILLSGTIQILEHLVPTAHEGLCTDLSLFTRDWWHDRKDNLHMFTVVVRVPARLLEVERPLEDGMLVLVEGRLNRWSGGTEYDNRQPVTGVEVERNLILHEPPREPRRSAAGATPAQDAQHASEDEMTTTPA